jgi:hypothetical protein
MEPMETEEQQAATALAAQQAAQAAQRAAPQGPPPFDLAAELLAALNDPVRGLELRNMLVPLAAAGPATAMDAPKTASYRIMSKLAESVEAMTDQTDTVKWMRHLHELVQLNADQGVTVDSLLRHLVVRNIKLPVAVNIGIRACAGLPDGTLDLQRVTEHLVKQVVADTGTGIGATMLKRAVLVVQMHWTLAQLSRGTLGLLDAFQTGLASLGDTSEVMLEPTPGRQPSILQQLCMGILLNMFPEHVRTFVRTDPRNQSVEWQGVSPMIRHIRENAAQIDVLIGQGKRKADGPPGASTSSNPPTQKPKYSTPVPTPHNKSGKFQADKNGGGKGPSVSASGHPGGGGAGPSKPGPPWGKLSKHEWHASLTTKLPSALYHERMASGRCLLCNEGHVLLDCPGLKRAVEEGRASVRPKGKN